MALTGCAPALATDEPHAGKERAKPAAVSSREPKRDREGGGNTDDAGGAGNAVDQQHGSDPEETDSERALAAHVHAMCSHMVAAADAFDVPQDFFVRLIWKESRLDPQAVSPVGAQGIAQFMPGTARLRGLDDPFDPPSALLASAAFLADLESRFGSWGLAAAGYNGGPNRIPPLVEGRAGLPAETRDYVFSITGRTAAFWARQAREARKAREATASAAEGTTEAPGSPDAAATATARPVTALEALVQRVGPHWPEGAGIAPSAPRGHAVASADAVLPPLEPQVVSAAVLPGQTGALIAHAVASRVPVPRPDVEPGPVDCPALVARLRQQRPIPLPTASGGSGWTPWGAQVAGHPRRSVALRQYARLRARIPADLVARGPTIVVRRFAARGRLPIHAVMFAAPDRNAAKALCKRIAAALAPCVVVKNP